MLKFKTPKLNTVRDLFQEGDERTELYRSSNWLVRWVFWGRLAAIARLIGQPRCGTCLDFGGGTGAMLPTLSWLFNKVVCADLDTALAEQMVARFGLNNVHVVNTDLLKDQGHGDHQFNAVVAADVLEHFRQLEPAIRSIKRNLRPNGRLYTSLPTENWLYVFLRLLLGKKKPADHFHDARTVEDMLAAHGFKQIGGRMWPSVLVPLFGISAWKC